MASGCVLYSALKTVWRERIAISDNRRYKEEKGRRREVQTDHGECREGNTAASTFRTKCHNLPFGASRMVGAPVTERRQTSRSQVVPSSTVSGQDEV
jgi:hypothetical protein